ncbi:MAG: multidrug ABC transporter ATP-binding protein [Gammaproteobacteria bacterium]|jgi:ABC-2 type transport system ATP-binding protein|nr:multidrug ABC transporter ATP-binding protein [Gammaproteobacteria bacterium]|tara:strand:- start:297 stop:1148 length:852 start_codon:yes stop_codon:yes gene_type:complete
MTAVVNARGLSKRYGDFHALRDVSFDIEPGSIVGLIGPNGAGKTTTLKSLLGLTRFDGELEVLGMDPRHGRHELMKRVCFIADVGVLPRWLKVKHAIDYIEGVHEGFDRDKAEALLLKTKISPSQKVRQLSKGMVTQLHLALVMAIEVDLLVLDEPTLGLDILYRKSFYERLLNDYFDHGTSIVISTHQVEEIESLLTHLIFIDEGEIVLSCSMEELPGMYSEVLVSPENIEQALKYSPIHSREILGKRSMIFEDVSADMLGNFGEVHTPSVADLFVAKMQKG